MYHTGVTLIDTLAATVHPGDSIRARRIELGWSQAELADAAGVTQGDISRIENAHLDARWSTIQRLSATLAAERPTKRSLANGANRERPDTSGRRRKPRHGAHGQQLTIRRQIMALRPLARRRRQQGFALG